MFWGVLNSQVKKRPKGVKKKRPSKIPEGQCPLLPSFNGGKRDRVSHQVADKKKQQTKEHHMINEFSQEATFRCSSKKKEKTFGLRRSCWENKEGDTGIIKSRALQIQFAA